MVKEEQVVQHGLAALVKLQQAAENSVSGIINIFYFFYEIHSFVL